MPKAQRHSHRRRRLCATALCTSLFALAMPDAARANDETVPDAVPTDADAEAPALRVGFGLGLATTPGGFGLSNAKPAYSIALEPTLLPALRLYTRAQVSAGAYSDQYGQDGEYWQVRGSVGPRLVVNPDDRLELSFYLLIGGSYLKFDGTGSASEVSLLETSPGIAVEYRLLDLLAVRLESDLGRAELYRNSQTGTDGTSDVVTGGGYAVGISPAVALVLRL